MLQEYIPIDVAGNIQRAASPSFFFLFSKSNILKDMSNNERFINEFQRLKEQAHAEGERGKMMTYSRVCKILKELPTINTIEDVESVKGLGKKSLEVIASLLATTPKQVTATKKRKHAEEEEQVENEDQNDSVVSLPELLLAQTFDPDKNDAKGWFMSEKLDGLRAFWDGVGGLWSRNGNRFYAPNSFTDHLPRGIVLDGELFCGRGKFHVAQSIVKSHAAGDERWKTVKYLVFDTPDNGSAPFEKRMDVCRQAIGSNNAVVQLVAQEVCRGNAHVEEKLQQIVAESGEGLMLRQPKSFYEGKRSKTLLKVKPSYDAEAIVIGYINGKGRNEGLVGSLQVKMENGKEFALGSGMTDADRKNPPKIGAIVTYQFTELQPSGVPRFPRFLRVRHDMTKAKDFAK
mgnify:CR=1 FL=1